MRRENKEARRLNDAADGFQSAPAAMRRENRATPGDQPPCPGFNPLPPQCRRENKSNELFMEYDQLFQSAPAAMSAGESSDWRS